MLICYYFILQVARNKCRRIHVGTVLGSRGPTVTPDASSMGVEATGPPTTSLEVPQGNLHTSTSMSPPHELSLPKANGHVVGNGRGPGEGQRVPGSGHEPPTLAIPTLLVSGLEVPDAQIVPYRSRSVYGMNRQRSQLVRPCLRRAQSNISMRPSTIRKKLSLGGRKPSWSWEASPAKGFRTVCVVVGTHVFTWAPYTALAVVEAILGPQRTHLIPHWATVTSTLLLFTASVFYPIVYGLYNRSIRKEVLACVCPSSSRARRRSCHRHTSTLNSNTGSVLDFSSLRQRESEETQQQQQEILAAHTLNKGCLPVPIKTISGTLTPLPPLLQLTECDGLPLHGYNFSARKPSQDSGAVMGSTDDGDSDLEGIVVVVPAPQQHHGPARRVSAPSILDTVCEDSLVTTAAIHGGSVCSSGSRRGSSSSDSSNVSRTSHSLSRKLPILPLSPQLLRMRHKRRLALWRSHSLEKLTSGDSQESVSLVREGGSPSPRKKTILSPLVRERQFGEPSVCERSRRRGSVSARKVTAIPEDAGISECPEIPTRVGAAWTAARPARCVPAGRSASTRAWEQSAWWRRTVCRRHSQ
ncbi:G-protein coupled receptor 161 [Chionoecetes opilio]|uniref:G-protein coupled receptor 161 n=1 Tax=Chionoecetes opilio TaxID=41210 RepID=A0A8J4YBD6_CHIOP|nr:G-protein coupled receptor 161 [Chionoecetes opilio]